MRYFNPDYYLSYTHVISVKKKIILNPWLKQWELTPRTKITYYTRSQPRILSRTTSLNNFRLNFYSNKPSSCILKRPTLFFKTFLPLPNWQLIFFIFNNYQKLYTSLSNHLYLSFYLLHLPQLNTSLKLSNQKSGQVGQLFTSSKLFFL